MNIQSAEISKFLCIQSTVWRCCFLSRKCRTNTEYFRRMTAVTTLMSRTKVIVQVQSEEWIPKEIVETSDSNLCSRCQNQTSDQRHIFLCYWAWCQKSLSLNMSSQKKRNFLVRYSKLLKSLLKIYLFLSLTFGYEEDVEKECWKNGFQYSIRFHEKMLFFLKE